MSFILRASSVNELLSHVVEVDFAGGHVARSILRISVRLRVGEHLIALSHWVALATFVRHLAVNRSIIITKHRPIVVIKVCDRPLTKLVILLSLHDVLRWKLLFADIF